MKTKFFINDEIFGSNLPLNECYKMYEDYYKDDGWILDKSKEDVFIIIDKEINLNEGDRVDLNAIRIISYKCVNIFDDIIEYYLREE